MTQRKDEHLTLSLEAWDPGVGKSGVSSGQDSVSPCHPQLETQVEEPVRSLGALLPAFMLVLGSKILLPEARASDAGEPASGRRINILLPSANVFQGCHSETSPKLPVPYPLWGAQSSRTMDRAYPCTQSPDFNKKTLLKDRTISFLYVFSPSGVYQFFSTKMKSP